MMINSKMTLLLGACALSVCLSPAAALAQSYGGANPSDYPGASSYAPAPVTPSVTPMSPSMGPPPSTHVFVPAGMMLSASLQTSISTEAAKSGDLVEANLSQPVMLGNGQLPAGTVLEGHVTTARSGGFLGRSGELTIQFDRIRMPGSMPIPIAAHISGNVGKYKPGDGNSLHGEGAGTKVGQALMRTAIGAGTGAALGTAVGAIAGHGQPNLQYKTTYVPEQMGYGGVQMMPVGYYNYRSGAAVGAGRGAWSGAAIGGGVGLADSLLLRRGHNVVIQSGTPIQIQLDAPVQLDHPYGIGAT